MKRLLAASLIVASISLAYAQTATFDIAKSAAATAKEAKITCKKLAVAPKSCVIAYFDEDFEVSKKPSEFYRVLNGKNADGQFIATDYYSNGQLQADPFTTRNRQALLTGGYTHILGITQKNRTGYHANGVKRSSTDYIDGLANGNGQSWYDNGTKESEGTLKNDKQTGEWTTWYENGKLESKGSYNDDGEKTGEWHSWYENGAAKEDANYKADVLEGARTYWHDNGKKHSQGPMENNLQTGQWTFWHENGEKESQGAFDDEEQRHGTWTEWDDAGKVIRTSVYANGALISVDGVTLGAAAAKAAEAVEATKAAGIATLQTTSALDADAAAEDLDTRCATFKRADQCVIAFFDKNSLVQLSAKNAAFYRVLYGKANDLYIVQDFFANGKKQSNVNFARASEGVLYSFDTLDLNAQGTIKGYDINGSEKFSSTFEQGHLIDPDDMQSGLTQADGFEELPTGTATVDAAKAAAHK
jgi:antitoxin component YwqK of YwqJK toxin-antitoxin module